MWDTLYAGGWPARLGRPLGLQGPLQVRRHEIPIDRPAAPGSVLRVGFISDLHAGPATHPALAGEACDAVARETPDLVLLGGDYVSFHARHADQLVEPLSRLRPPLGTFAVLGNHDLIGDERYIVERLAEAGVRTLVNENVRLAAPHDDLWLVGLDNFEEGTPDAARAFAGADGTRLVLMHSPDGLTPIGDRPFAAALCGHVHGGQFWLRGRSLISFHGPLSVQYLRGGVFPLAEGGSTLIVSRGIGCGNLPMRRGADPEVLLCTFRARP
ncbi:MAG TPA: metallophosphoesterase [Gemmatimonadaceae bacterium]|nr:metallophosphoesterase [Gemmatimonadaceae bacterium]